MKFTDIKKKYILLVTFSRNETPGNCFLELIIFITTPLKLNYID